MFSHLFHAGRAIVEGMRDPDHVTGSLKVGAGGAVLGLTALAAGVIAAPVLPVIAVGTGLGIAARAIKKANE